MSDEKNVEHHWHEPGQGQVTKAIFQYLQTQGVTGKKLEEVVEKKVAEAVQRKVDQLLESGRFDKMILAAIADFIGGEKKAYEANRYGYENRLRDLVKERIKEVLLSDYEVVVRPKDGAKV